MKKEILIPVFIALAIGLIGGFFIGQEYTKQKIVNSIEEAFSDTSSNDGKKAEESGEMAEEVKKMNNINVSIGDTVELATFKYVVNEVQEKDLIKSDYGQPHLATEGTKFVIVDLAVTNTTSETFDYDDSSPVLEDSNGDFYKTYSDTIGNIDNYMDWRELSPNIPETGVIVFQIPKTVDSYQLLTAKANSNDIYRVELK